MDEPEDRSEEIIYNVVQRTGNRKVVENKKERHRTEFEGWTCF